MWGWIEPVLKVLLAWLEGKAKEPSAMWDVETPLTIRERWAANLRNKLRDKNGGN